MYINLHSTFAPLTEAYKRAQKDANDFTTLPDEELAMEMKRLDEMAKKTIESANHERDELIQSKSFCCFVLGLVILI